MTPRPGWTFDLTPPTLTVLGTGLPTNAPWPGGPLDSTAWNGLLNDCARHKLRGLLVHAVAIGDLATTTAQRVEVAQIEIDLTRARMWHEARLIEVIRFLAGHHIGLRVLKGPAVGRLDYPDVQMRPTGDIDLLVGADQMMDAIAALESDGARRVDTDPIVGWAATIGKGATMAMPDGLEVDLHRILTWGPFGLRIPPDDLWRASRPFEVGGVELATLPIEETLIHASYHLQIDSGRRALTLRDVAQLMSSPQLDADRLARLSRRWRADAIVAGAVLLAADTLGLDHHGDVASWASGVEVSWLDRALVRMERPEDEIGIFEPVAVYGSLRTADERRIFRLASLHPLPNSWPAPQDRIRRGLGRLRRHLVTSG